MTNRSGFNHSLAALSVLVLAAMPASAGAQTADSKTDIPGDDSGAKAMHGGILPLQKFGGALTERGFLLGDWGGLRTDLAKKGIRFRGSLTPLLQSIEDGGIDETSGFSQSGDIWLALDFHRMGLIRGGLLVARAEFDTGRNINNKTGTLFAPSYNTIVPVSGEVGRDVFALTSLYYTQFLGERFGVWFGRTDTHHNANLNEFTGLSPRVGKTQFQNLALTAIPVMPVSQPYVTALGAGVFARPTDNLELAALVIDSRESSLTSGFDDFGRDWNSFITAAYRHRIGDLPGRQLIGYSYSWNGDYTTLDQSQLLNLVRGTPLQSEEETWALIYSGFQYIQVFGGDTSKPINLKDGRADLRGWGIFLLAGLADKDTNPIQWSLAAGIGGRGLMESRPNDEYGIGYFVAEIKSGVVADIIGLKNTEQGMEVYYDFEVVPSFHVTTDLQVIDPGVAAADTAVILGLRANITF